MKLKWYGHSCFGLTFADGTAVVTDPFDETVGYPLCAARADIALLSHDHFDHNHVQSLAGNPYSLCLFMEHALLMWCISHFTI